jgi:tetratricopeptide (TPR) repeat protein
MGSTQQLIAWLNNGICLYNAIKLKANPSDALFTDIYNTLCKSLNDLSSVCTNDAIYLKSNLISNASFLLEIKKSYGDSYKLLSAYYADIADLNKRDLKSCHINYRLGTLQLKMKNYSSALMYYNKCLESLQCIPRPLLHEKLCRVISIAHLGLNKPKKAMDRLKQGLKICIEQCSEKGITYYNHAIKTLGEPIDFNTIPPKLPAFIPEIDLEDIPPINLNEYLAK